MDECLEEFLINGDRRGLWVGRAYESAKKKAGVNFTPAI